MTAGFNFAVQSGSPAGASAIGGATQAGLFGKAGGSAAGGAAGFDALMAALFGGQGFVDPAAAQQGAAPAPALAGAMNALVVEGATQGDAEGAEAPVDGEAEPTILDESLSAEAQAVAMLLTQPVAVQAKPAAAPADPTVAGEKAGEAMASDGKAMASNGKARASSTPAGAVATAIIPDEKDATDIAATAIDPLAAADDDGAPQLAALAAPPAKTSPAQRSADKVAEPAYAQPKAAEAPVINTAPEPAARIDAPQADAPPAPVETQAQTTLSTAVATPSPEKPAARVAAKGEVSKRAEASAPRAEAPAAAPTDPATQVVAAAPSADTGSGDGQGEPGEKPLATTEKLAGPDKSDAAAPAAGPTQFASTEAEAPVRATTPVRGSPETVAALAAEIVKKLDGRTTRFDVELNPVDLGRVDVRIEIGAHGRVTASMAFENPQAAAELKSRADDLQKALEQAGFELSGGLSFDVANDQGGTGRAFSDQAGSDFSGQARGRAFQAALDTAGDSADAALASALAYRSRPATGVDIRI